MTTAAWILLRIFSTVLDYNGHLGISVGVSVVRYRHEASNSNRSRELKMIDKKLLLASLTACSLSFSASVLSDASAADELMAALKACKADAAAMKSAQAMIKKHGGKPSDDQIDDWVDDQDDKLFDCLDKKL